MSALDISETDVKEAVNRQDGEAENPYLSARRHLISEEQRAFQGELIWQCVALILGLIALAAVGGIAYIGSQSKYTPYVVLIDRLGEAVAAGPADKAAQADSRVVRASLAAWISSARGVTPDVALEREAVFRVYAMLQAKDPATLKVQEWWSQDRKTDPFSRAATETVSVEVVSALPISEKAWQVDWVETTRERDGSLKGQVRMRAVLDVYTAPLSSHLSEQELARNPLGIYVRDFTWTKVS